MRTTTTTALALLAGLTACGDPRYRTVQATDPWGPTAIIRACDRADGLDRLECLMAPRQPAMTAAARRFQERVRQTVYVYAVSATDLAMATTLQDQLEHLEGQAMQQEKDAACAQRPFRSSETVNLWRAGIVHCPPL